MRTDTKLKSSQQMSSLFQIATGKPKLRSQFCVYLHDDNQPKEAALPVRIFLPDNRRNKKKTYTYLSK